jgi:hypothetical protein
MIAWEEEVVLIATKSTPLVGHWRFSLANSEGYPPSAANIATTRDKVATQAVNNSN